MHLHFSLKSNFLKIKCSFGSMGIQRPLFHGEYWQWCSSDRSALLLGSSGNRESQNFKLQAEEQKRHQFEECICMSQIFFVSESLFFYSIKSMQMTCKCYVNWVHSPLKHNIIITNTLQAWTDQPTKFYLIFVRGSEPFYAIFCVHAFIVKIIVSKCASVG